MSGSGNPNNPVVAGPAIYAPQASLQIARPDGMPSVYMFQWMQSVYAALAGQGGIIDIVDIQAPSPGQTMGLAESLLAASGERAFAPQDPGGQIATLEDRMFAVEAFIAQQRGYVQVSPSMVAWTPTLIGSGTAGVQVYTTQWGGYFQIGPAILALFNIQLSTLGGTIAGNAIIGGLPFPANGAPGVQPMGGVISRYGNITFGAGYTQLGATVAAGASQLALFESGSANAGIALPVTGLAATSFVAGGILYFR